MRYWLRLMAAVLMAGLAGVPVVALTQRGHAGDADGSVVLISRSQRPDQDAAASSAKPEPLPSPSPAAATGSTATSFTILPADAHPGG